MTSIVTSTQSQSGAQTLLINPDKTKLLIVGVPQLTQSLSLPPVVLMGEKHQALRCRKRLGVWVDTAVTFDDHISKLSSSCLYKLRGINRIKHLDSKILTLIINALIFSWLFYCSNVWGNTSSKNICKLQLIQSFAGRIILGLKKLIMSLLHAIPLVGYPSVRNSD